MALTANSLPALVAANAQATPDAVVLRRKDRGIWKPTTWSQLSQRMHQIAGAILASGLAAGSRIGILSDTRVDWGVLDLAIQAAGCVAVGYNPAEPPAVLGRQLAETGCALLFVENDPLLENVLEARSLAPGLRRIVVIDMKGLRDFSDAQCVSLDDFQSTAAAVTEVDASIGRATAQTPAAVAYTSGDTQESRPVLFTHGNLMALAAAGRALDLRRDDERLAFLPMYHVLERMLGFYLGLLSGAISNYVEGADTLPENLQELQPTVLIAPPRFWRRLYARVRAAESEATTLQRWLLKRTMSSGGLPGGNRLLRTVRHTLGIDRLRRAGVAFGSLPTDVTAFFEAVGVPVFELYGTTETAGFGFITQTLGSDARLSATGEIEVRGAHLASGYWDVSGKTDILAADGWFATGDRGRSEGGALRPAGRVADASGQSRLEAALRSSPFIADAVAIPAGNDFDCLIMLDPDTVEPWAQRAKVPFTGFGSLARAKPVRALIAEAVAQVNAAAGGSGRVRHFHLIEQRFEPGDAELSPNFQLRRALVHARYQKDIERMRHEA